MSYSHDPRRPIMVNGNAYRRAMEAHPASAADTLTDIAAALALFAFLAGLGAWLTIFAA